MANNPNISSTPPAGAETIVLSAKHLLWVVAFIEGTAVIGVELLAAKLLSSFYGASLYVWTAVLSISVLGLACGYFLGGFLSQKNTTVFTLFALCGLSAVTVYFMPIVNDAAVSFTKSMDLIPGVTICSALLLLPSIICFGTIGPLLVHFTKYTFSSIETAPGNVFFISTLGGIFAAFSFGYYVIPSLGLTFTAKIMAAFLLMPFFVFVLFKKLFLLQTKTQDSFSLDEDSKANVNVDFSAAQIYTISLIEGATVMSLQLLATRMIAPYFGSSIMVWASVMGITLLSLAMGYFTGSRLPKTWKNISAIWWILLAVGICVSTMHIFSSRMPFWLSNLDLIPALLVVSVFVVIPSLYFLGMIPTHLVKLRRHVSDAGAETGKIYGISALGGILAMPFFGFWIIPQFGLTVPSILLALLIGTIPAVVFLAKKKYVGLAFLACLIFSFSQRSVAKPSKNVKVVEYSEGLMGQLLIADLFINGKGEPINDRTMFINRMGQTVIDNATGNSRYVYITFASSVASVLPENSKALILGLGGGSMAKALSNNLQFEVDAVELDERIARAAKKHFALGEKVNVVVDDARHYMETTDKKYDLIFFDVFKGDVLPSQVLTKESFERARKLLNSEGVVMVNLNGFITGDLGKPGRNVFKTLRAAGFNVNLLPTPGAEKDRNNLFIATMDEKDYSKVRSPLLFKGVPVSIPTLFEVVNEDKEITIYSDDCSALERHNLMAGNTWRRDYNASVTPYLIENQVPLFK